MLHKNSAFWKNRRYLTFSGICLVVLLFLIVRIALPNKTFMYDDIRKISSETSAEVIIYDNVALYPGVWRVCLEYETDTDYESYCTVRDGTVISGGLLANYEHLYSQLGQTDFEIWLFERAKHLQVLVAYSGNGEVTAGRLTLIETDQLWTMLMTILLFLWGAVTIVARLAYREKQGKLPQEKRQVIFWGVVITLIASLPFMQGGNYEGADLAYHYLRIEGVRDGILAGFFPVRLEPRWLYDHGYDNAIFYCNAYLLLPGLLRVLGFPICYAYSIYGIAINALTTRIAYYSFHKIFQDHKIALSCCALYVLSIIRIYKLVITSAIGEGTAMTFLPLIAYGLYRIFAEEPKKKEYRDAWIPLSLGLTGIIACHVLTCEIMGFVMFLTCILFIRRVFVKETFLNLAKAAVMTLLFSVWFLLPFVDYYLTQDIHVKHVHARIIQYEGLQPAHLFFHFWPLFKNEVVERSGLYQAYPSGVGLTLMIGLILFLILWFSGAFEEEKTPRLAFFKKMSLLGVAMLILSQNVFPWDRIQDLNPVFAALVSSLQFPNRFLGWGCICLILAFGYCMAYYETEQNWIAQTVLPWVVIIGIVTSGLYLTDHVAANVELLYVYAPGGI